jgi:hypothetical protein
MLAVIYQWVKKRKAARPNLLTQVKELAPTAAAAGTIGDDPPLVDHPHIRWWFQRRTSVRRQPWKQM